MSTLLDDTPHDYFDEGQPPSRGQFKLIALEACKLLGIDVPDSRLAATIALVKLRKANITQDGHVDHAVADAAGTTRAGS